MDAEQFIIHVATCIERELKQWDPTYRVMLLKLQNYELFVDREEEETYQLTISEDEVIRLQNRSPYSLDKNIWEDLQKQGLQIMRCYGNYLDYVLPENK